MKHLADFYEALKAALAIESSTTSVLFGAEHLARRDGQGLPTANRVVVVPHDDGGDTGTFLPPSHTHRDPPEVGIDRQNVLIETWAYDGSAPTDRAKQFVALAALRQAVWRNAQAIIRANHHVTPPAIGAVPGYYQARRKALPSPTERVHGMREQMVFWIDFSVRELEPTTLDEPDLTITAELESP